MSSVCITFDIDWATDEALQYLIDKLTKHNIKASFFATHDTKVLTSINSNLFEVGIHPNFNDSNGDFITPIQNLMEIYPNAIGGRSHSLFCSSNILKTYEAFGLKYESNIFLPFHDNLKVTKRRKNLVSIPFFWSDDYCLDNYLLDVDFPTLIDNESGLKVFNFHPIHIFANTPSNKFYEKIRPHYHNSEKLIQLRNNSKIGICDLFDQLLNFISKYSITPKLMSEYIQ
ncbi:hypothetical protein DID74_00375 [Candidatus Marinamargulisbacteria bacterium SCGC AG-333-B06]|nr:hypothetical protein DID74_00375 [Candidatus Marinamargulisbacteria bacterium SCGC AG-333-B06]